MAVLSHRRERVEVREGDAIGHNDKRREDKNVGKCCEGMIEGGNV
jgi:hypothetical protein